MTSCTHPSHRCSTDTYGRKHILHASAGDVPAKFLHWRLTSPYQTTILPFSAWNVARVCTVLALQSCFRHILMCCLWYRIHRRFFSKNGVSISPPICHKFDHQFVHPSVHLFVLVWLDNFCFSEDLAGRLSFWVFWHKFRSDRNKQLNKFLFSLLCLLLIFDKIREK